MTRGVTFQRAERSYQRLLGNVPLILLDDILTTRRSGSCTVITCRGNLGHAGALL